MANNIDLWWSKFHNKADSIVWDTPHYYKEKYWRFDINVYWDLPDTAYEELLNIEEESLNTCQRCAELSKQYWTSGWWLEHFCLPCYIIVWVKSHWRRFKYKIKEIWKRT